MRVQCAHGGLAFIDWDTTLLPDDLTLPLLWAGLLASGQWTTIPWQTPCSAPVQATCRSAGVLGLQARHRQRHGLRRLQAFCGHGRLVWLAGLVPWILMASVVGAVVGIAMKMASSLRERVTFPSVPLPRGRGLIGMVFRACTGAEPVAGHTRPVTAPRSSSLAGRSDRRHWQRQKHRRSHAGGLRRYGGGCGPRFHVS